MFAEQIRNLCWLNCIRSFADHPTNRGSGSHLFISFQVRPYGVRPHFQVAAPIRDFSEGPRWLENHQDIDTRGPKNTFCSRKNMDKRWQTFDQYVETCLEASNKLGHGASTWFKPSWLNMLFHHPVYQPSEKKKLVLPQPFQGFKRSSRQSTVPLQELLDCFVVGWLPRPCPWTCGTWQVKFYLRGFFGCYINGVFIHVYIYI